MNINNENKIHVRHILATELPRTLKFYVSVENDKRVLQPYFELRRSSYQRDIRKRILKFIWT